MNVKEGLVKIINSKSKTFLAFCFCFIAGVVASSLVEDRVYGQWLGAVLMCAIVATGIFWHEKYKRFVLACLALFAFGGVRFLFALPATDAAAIHSYNNRTLEISGWISAEPEIKTAQARYVISVERCTDDKVCDDKLYGKVLVTMPLYPRFEYGDMVALTCKLRSPQSSDSDFRYDKYLERSGITSLCFNPEVKHTGIGRGNKATGWLLAFKEKIKSTIERLWPEPESSFMAGILYGDRSGLPKAVSDNFARTGISHIIAVSGYNITIVVSAVMGVLIYIGFYRQRAYWLVLGFVALFIVFSGASASVVRAGVMGSVALTAQQIGRPWAGGRLLIYAAVVMALINPYTLVWDVGFQLSFLAAAGLIYLAPLFGAGTYTMLSKILVETIAATAATLPLVLFHFGRLSLVSLLVNPLVVWIIPLLMAVGFAAVLVGFAVPFVGMLAAWPAYIGMRYVIMMATWFGKQPWSTVSFTLPWWLMIAAYACMVWWVMNKNKKSPVVVE